MLSGKLLMLVVAAVVAGVTGVTNAVFGPRARARRRLQRGARQIADREIVTLVGKVRVLDALVAPLSGRDCVAYEACGRLYEGEGRSRMLSRQVVDAQMTTFELVIGDDIVTVEGERAEIALPLVPVIPRKLEREVRFLQAHEVPVELVTHGGFDEAVVENGDTIAVQGMAIVELASHSTSERGYRDAPPQRVRLVAHTDHPLTIGKP